jgi:DNA-binding protein
MEFEVFEMTDLPLAAIARIAKKNGAERIGEDASKKLAEKAEAYVARVTVEAVKLAGHAGRKTLKAEDFDLVTI